MKWYFLYLSWLIALVATCGSLYMSEVERMPVCPLCWYQRICMFPLALLLGIAAYRRFYEILLYILPLAVIGWLLAAYQAFEQYFPGVLSLGLCSKGGLCSEKGMNLFGFLTFPLLSVLAFTCIIVFSAIIQISSEASEKRT
jgi:disulfide bond formation protein DsbB